MGLIRVCDKCGKRLEQEDTKLNYIEIEYYRKKYEWDRVFIPDTLTLCEDCFKELIGTDVKNIFTSEEQGE